MPLTGRSTRPVSPLLGTKLHVPRLRAGPVTRPLLVERLQRATQAKLTLISAPAGSGKTSLLAEWTANPDGPQSPGWLSLDATDNEPATFWAYVIAVLQKAAPEVAVEAFDPEPGSEAAAIDGPLPRPGPVPVRETRRDQPLGSHM